MSTLYTLAYPEISASDNRFIERFRDEYDLPYRDVVRAHFTLVFGCTELDSAEYQEHIEAIAHQSAPIEFHCKYAMLGTGADADRDTAYVFLVPDGGYADLSLLHDRLYGGVLAPFLRLDVPFTPHINIGTLSDRAEAKELCDSLNQEGVSVPGRVGALIVGDLEDGKIVDLASFELRGADPSVVSV